MTLELIATTTSTASDVESNISILPTEAAETQVPTFQYQPLDQNIASIRLLVLLPKQGDDGSLLRCELVHVTFREKPSYRALSYMWGNLENTTSLLVNGQLLEVRKNLHEALAGLRNEIEGQFLWVDAICINQGDDDERSSQVFLMDHIYTRAKLVVIWLEGEWQLFTNFSELSRQTKEQIAAHDYWTRLWIVQEIILSVRLKVFVGQSSTSWSNFLSQSELIDNYKNLSLQHEDIVLNIDRKRKDRHGPSNRLEILLESFQYAKCQEPRDRIYGLLGLAHDCQDGSITADYTKPLFQLYVDVVTFFCRRRKFNNLATNELDRSMRLVRFSQLMHKILEGLRHAEVPPSLDTPLFRVRGAAVGEIFRLGPTYDEFLSVPKAVKNWKMGFETVYSKPEHVQRLRENNEAYSAQLLDMKRDDLKVFPINPQALYSRAVKTNELWDNEKWNWEQQDPHIISENQFERHEDPPAVFNTEPLSSEPGYFWETTYLWVLRQLERSLATLFFSFGKPMWWRYFDKRRT